VFVYLKVAGVQGEWTISPEGGQRSTPGSGSRGRGGKGGKVMGSRVLMAGGRGGHGPGVTVSRTADGQEIIYIRTPSGGVVGIPARSQATVSGVPRGGGAGGGGVRTTTQVGGGGGGVFPGPPVRLSTVPPKIDEYNVWSVLEKLLAATQSMGMLLGSLKEDLRRTATGGGAGGGGGGGTVNIKVGEPDQVGISSLYKLS